MCKEPVYLTALFCLCLLFSGCERKAGQGNVKTTWDQPFRIELDKVPASRSRVEFNNSIYDKGNMNPFVWNFIYTGGGVATGDLDNDGLPDIYFAGNQVADKIYRNRGDFRFEDVSIRAGITDDLWSTGVTFADVNADGLLDIYVCKTSPTLQEDRNRNKLFINKGDFQFEESAGQYGIADIGYSIQASFFDMDQDGDLDMYLVNQPLDQFAKLLYPPAQVQRYRSGDKIYHFENGRFVDRTPAFLQNDPRYGLGISLGDFNRDGWTDIYVCNDYHHGDWLLINDAGQFRDEIRSRTGHTSFYSMGSDAGDINNDGWEDVVILDMAFSDHFRSKTNMLSMNPDFFWQIVEDGQHYQYAVNTLQLNKGDGTFSEIGQLSGIAKTDWSWTALFADLDLDGYQDLVVSNGILRDMKNNDFTRYINQTYQGRIGPDNYLEAMEHLPSTPVTNHLFRNSGHLKFDDISSEVGFVEKGFSHGLAYADLDLDGRTDIVMNNMQAAAGIYQNVSVSTGNYLQVALRGQAANTHGLGIAVTIYRGNEAQTATMQTTRGYYSASEPILHFGLGKATQADSLVVRWNAEERTTMYAIPAGQRMTVDHEQSIKQPYRAPGVKGIPFHTTQHLAYRHREETFDDFEAQVLLPYKLSQLGPFMASADANNDGNDDFYIGGAAGQPGELYLQQPDGKFRRSEQPAFRADGAYEDGEPVFLDYDRDGDKDLFVVSGSGEFPEGHRLLEDRLYANDGNGVFTRTRSVLPSDIRINGKSVVVFDYENDGDPDLFVGGRQISGQYPLPPASKILQNRNGIFRDVTRNAAPWLDKAGMITDAVQADMDQDGDADLVLVGEWMHPVIALQGSGKLARHSLIQVPAGIYWSVEAADMDLDGDLDLLLGNLGQNNKFSISDSAHFEVLAGDFDQNGDHDVFLASQKKDRYLPVRGRECSSQELPFILDKFPTYSDYGRAEVPDILTEAQRSRAYHREVSSFQHFYARNEGNLDFKPQSLPMACQTGVIQDFEVTDFNQDGLPDFLFIGNFFPAEVETARYDGLLQGVCIQSSDGQFNFVPVNNLPIRDYRQLVRIQQPGGKEAWILSANNSRLLVGCPDILQRIAN